MDRYAGYVLTSTLGLFTTKKKPPKRPKRILVIKLWAVGESILTLPLIAALRRHFPNAKIDVLASRRNASVYEHQQAVRKVIMPTEVIRKPTYDLVFDCEPYFNLSALMGWLAGTFSIGFAHGSRAKVYSAKVPYNPRQHVVYTYLDLLKPLGLDANPQKLIPLGFAASDDSSVNRLLKQYKVKKRDMLIGLGTGAGDSIRSRMWSPARYARLADKLIKKYGCRDFSWSAYI